ncbi:hypothetical protein RRF57_009510 [Xylaria bambusicola]|uniref:Uncharacterized protein n=1 Tax=Xylaria bambusicola TaxID=326684 RepID=A0AAN7UVP4_9PEZI
MFEISGETDLLLDLINVLSVDASELSDVSHLSNKAMCYGGLNFLDPLPQGRSKSVENGRLQWVSPYIAVEQVSTLHISEIRI